jgi:pimeloyl-ACP methyl ester carboxylesterase
MSDNSMTLPDGRTLAWGEYGAPDGDPLLFFHGLPSSRKFGGALAADAKATGLRVIAPDRPGFGDSTMQPNRRFVDWGADVGALVDHLGIDRFYAAGISGGGVYTLVAAHQFPERVRSAAVISGAGEISEPGHLDGMHEQNRALFELAMSGGVDAVADAMKPMMEMLAQGDADELFEQSASGLPQADRDLLARRKDIRDAMRDDGIEGTKQGVDGIAREAWLFVQPWAFDVSEIGVPVVIFHGDDDRNAPLSHAQALAAKIPNAELVVWTGMGHLTSLERMKDVFGRLVELAD